ncbi:MAG: 4Fe-4S binding protein [Bacillota bacterium]
MASDRRRWILDPERCKGCGLCVAACPEEILRFSDRTNRAGYRTVKIIGQDECISCGLCAISCPDVAIEVFRPEKKKDKSDGRDRP